MQTLNTIYKIIAYTFGAILIGWCILMVLASTFVAFLFPFGLLASLLGLI